MTRTNRLTWRRLTAVATIGAAVAAMAAALAAPAHATVGIGAPLPYHCTTAADAPKFIGWATMSYRGCVDPSFPQTADCRAETAYRWTGSTWSPRQIGECGIAPIKVYVYPYASGWSWIWTQQNGWLAVRSNLVRIHAGHASGLH